MNMLTVGTRIYYTGDIANASDWATITEVLGPVLTYRLAFDDGGESCVHAIAIGEIYHGHCNPRFVTEAAYQTYRTAQLERLKL